MIVNGEMNTDFQIAEGIMHGFRSYTQDILFEIYGALKTGSVSLGLARYFI